MILKTAVLDDEPAFQKKVEEYIQKWARDEDTAVFFRSYSKSDLFLADYMEDDFDVVFLDIRLSEDRTGMDVAQEIRAQGRNTIIIFLTGDSSLIGQAFDVQAFQYLLKPVHYPQIEKYMHRAVQELKSRRRPFYLCSADHTQTRVDLNDILYFSSAGHRTTIHTVNGTLEEWKLLKDVALALPSHFVRCSKSHIVNMAEVKKLSRKELVLSTGKVIRIGASYSQAVNECWISFYV